MQYPGGRLDDYTGGEPQPPPFYDEDEGEAVVVCPRPTTTTTTTTTIKTTTTAVQIPVESPRETGLASENVVSCYKFGQKTENARMVNAARDFCQRIAKDSLIGPVVKSHEVQFDYNGGVGSVKIKMAIDIFDECEFPYTEALCMKYFSVPTDSCDCSGINDKHGGYVKNNCYRFKIDPEWSY